MRNEDIDIYDPPEETDRDKVIRYLEDLSAKSRYKYIKRAIQLVIREIMYNGPAMITENRDKVLEREQTEDAQQTEYY